MLVEMEPRPRVWIVEASLTLATGVRPSELERRAFFRAMTDAEGSELATPEVGWTSDDSAYVALATEALTAEDAGATVTAVIRRGAIPSAGLTADRATIAVSSVVPLTTRQLARQIWPEG